MLRFTVVHAACGQGKDKSECRSCDTSCPRPSQYSATLPLARELNASDGARACKLLAVRIQHVERWRGLSRAPKFFTSIRRSERKTFCCWRLQRLKSLARSAPAPFVPYEISVALAGDQTAHPVSSCSPCAMTSRRGGVLPVVLKTHGVCAICGSVCTDEAPSRVAVCAPYFSRGPRHRLGKYKTSAGILFFFHRCKNAFSCSISRDFGLRVGRQCHRPRRAVDRYKWKPHPGARWGHPEGTGFACNKCVRFTRVGAQVNSTFYWFGEDKAANSALFSAVSCYTVRTQR